MNAVTQTEAQALNAPAGLARLRAKVPDHLVSRLPKGGTSLDYVGHAATTHILLDADPAWSWEPLAFTEQGLPRFDESGGLWIRLTVCGVTRLGYGHADKKSGAVMAGARDKEVIGDAIRNAAMRFGLALDLWSKADLHAEQHAEVHKPDADETLLASAQEAALEGTASYAAFWSGLVPTDRQLIGKARHDQFKKMAEGVQK